MEIQFAYCLYSLIIASSSRKENQGIILFCAVIALQRNHIYATEYKINYSNPYQRYCIQSF